MRSMGMSNASDPVLVEGCRVRLKSAPWVIMTVRSVLPVSTGEPEDEATSRRRYVVEWQEKDGPRKGETQERSFAREELELVPESEWETLKQEIPTGPVAGAVGAEYRSPVRRAASWRFILMEPAVCDRSPPPEIHHHIHEVPHSTP